MERIKKKKSALKSTLFPCMHFKPPINIAIYVLKSTANGKVGDKG